MDPLTRSMFEDQLKSDDIPTYESLYKFVSDRLRECELLEKHPDSTFYLGSFSTFYQGKNSKTNRIQSACISMP